MKIGLSAFLPFHGEDLNVSEKLVERIASELKVPWIVLPVSWDRSFPILKKFIQQHQLSDLFMFGQATGATKIRLERVGLNFQGAHADEDGVSVEEGALDSRVLSTEQARFTKYPIGNWKKDRDDLIISLSAGDFICNAVYFRALELPLRSLFVHLPLLPEQKAAAMHPSIPLEQQVHTVRLLHRTWAEWIKTFN